MNDPDDDRRTTTGRRSTDEAARELGELAKEAGAVLSAWEDSRAVILEALEQTRAAVGMLAETIKTLASKEELEAVKQQQDRRAHRLIVALAVAALSIAGLAGLTAVGWSVIESNRQNVRILNDCTTPGDRVPTNEDPRTGHRCYDDGQARTRAAVAELARIMREEVDRALERAGIPKETSP